MSTTIMKKQPGRPRIPGLRRYCVKLDLGTHTRAKQYGRGNLSRGIRERFSTDVLSKGEGK